jgi:hypothetical protein
MKTVIVVNHNAMGSGDESLGRQILRDVFREAPTLEGLEAILCYNAGVKVLFEDSLCLPELTALEQSGIAIRACGLSLERFADPGKLCVGEVATAGEMLALLDKAEKVLTL